MTKDEAREAIAKEFIESFYEWLDDLKLPEKEYWGKGYDRRPKEGVVIKDNLTGVVKFQSSIFSGRWLMNWKKLGYTLDVLLDLERDGFLSHQHYWNRYKRVCWKSKVFQMWCKC